MSRWVSHTLRLRTIETFGEAGERWLEALPARIRELESRWSLIVGEPFQAGNTCSWVAPVHQVAGESAVLKINYPERESRYEAEALRLLGGSGAVQLLRSSDDDLCILLERCTPGADLWSVNTDEANAIGADLLFQIGQEPPPGAPFELLDDLVQEWIQNLPLTAPAAGYPLQLVRTAVEVAIELQGSAPRPVLLHGDFHPGNVLASSRQPWLAIDPKPLVGDPAYDLAQWIGCRCESFSPTSNPILDLRRQIDEMCRRINVEPARAACWAFVKALGWDWGPDVAQVLLGTARI